MSKYATRALTALACVGAMACSSIAYPVEGLDELESGANAVVLVLDDLEAIDVRRDALLGGIGWTGLRRRAAYCSISDADFGTVADAINGSVLAETEIATIGADYTIRLLLSQGREFFVTLPVIEEDRETTVFFAGGQTREIPVGGHRLLVELFERIGC